MKKHIIVFLFILSVTIGFATLSTVLDIKGNVNLAENKEDFRIELTNLKINDTDQISLVSNDKQTFTFTGSGNDSISYTITNYSYQYDANIKLVCTPSDKISIEQIGELLAQSEITKSITSTSTNEITCTINVEKISRSEYAEDMCTYKEGDIWEFNYTGAEQEFKVPCDGVYSVELYGAQGGDNGSYIGGNGGRVTASLLFDNSQQIYINIGGKGTTFNGGGEGNTKGGGATDIRVEENIISNRVLVAGGGGAASQLENGNAGSDNDNLTDVLGIGGESTTGGAGGGGYYGGESGTLIYHKHSSSCSATCTYTIVNQDNGNGSWSHFITHRNCGKGTERINDTNNQSYWGTGGTHKYYVCKKTEGVSVEEHSPSYGGSNYISSIVLNEYYHNSEYGVRSGDGYAKITYLGKLT